MRYIRGTEQGKRDPYDLALFAGYRVAKSGVNGVAKDVLGADPVGTAQGAFLEEAPGAAEERLEYQQRPDAQRLDERTDVTSSHAGKTVREVFG